MLLTPIPSFMPTAGAAFNPSSVTPDWWIDPSDLSTMFQLTSGTTAVTTTGDPVGTITDKGASGSNLIAGGNDTKRPSYTTSSGLRWIQWDGVNNWGLSSAIGKLMSGFMTATDFDVFCAGWMPTPGSNVNPYSDPCVFTDLNGGDCGLSFHSTLGAQFFCENTTPALKTLSDAYVAGAAFVCHLRLTGGVMSLTQNARSTVTLSLGTSNQFAGTLTSRITSGAYYGAGIPTGDLKIAGIIARKTLLGSTDVASMMTWLGNKVGLSL